MTRLIRRVVLIVAIVALSAGGGSALFAAPAFAGGVDTENGNFAAGVYNLTPYPWTLVAAATPEPGICSNNTCWLQYPAQTIAPGKAMVYGLAPNYSGGGGISFSDKFGYDGWMTYRIDVLAGPPEYVTIALSQEFSNGVFGNNIPALRQFITSAPPASSYDPGPNPDVAPAPLTASPQLTYAAFVPTPWDLTYTLTGNYTVDAATALGAPFVQLLNSVCGASPTACTFTQTQPLYWSIGTPRKVGAAPNCTVTPGAKRAPAPGSPGDEPPPPLDPNWQEVEYEAEQKASLTVGGGVTVGTEFNLFNSISGKISVKIEAEHEWQETKTFGRSSKVYVPSNEIGQIWMAPTVAKVTGTLVLKSGSATFTAINFSEQRSGVSRGDETPAFNVITRIRPMTASELKTFCGSSQSPTLGSPEGKPPAKLVPGRGVAKVALGQTLDQVARALGQPSVKLFSQNRCRGLDPGCDAIAGVAGTWVYRQLSVVFAAGGRVTAIVYRGRALSARGVGVGSRLAAVRRAYPGVSCTTGAEQRYCTLRSVYAGRAVKTVFVFTEAGAGQYRSNRVAIYVVDPASGR